MVFRTHYYLGDHKTFTVEVYIPRLVILIWFHNILYKFLKLISRFRSYYPWYFLQLKGNQTFFFLCLSLESFLLYNTICVAICRKDTFKPDRATGEPGEAHKSNFLHPVLYFYKNPPTGIVASCLISVIQEICILGQILRVHQLYLETFFLF